MPVDGASAAKGSKRKRLKVLRLDASVMSEERERSGWPSYEVFQILQAGDVKKLWGCPPRKLRPFLPYLVRMALSPSPPHVFDSQAETWARDRKLVLSLIADIPEANSVQSYLHMNFPELRSDAVKERQLLRKLGRGEERPTGQSVLATSMQFGMAIEFERSDHIRKFRLFLSEILRVMSKVDTQFSMEQSDLFESEVHLAEIGDIMAIAVEELPSLLGVVSVAEALLRLPSGTHLLTCLVANMPDQLDHVLTSLLVNGETQDEVSLAGRCRTAALSSLLLLHPPSSPHVQALSLLHHKHPTLALSIALDSEEKLMSTPGFDSGTSLRPDVSMELGHVLAPPPTPTGVVTLLHDIIITGDEETKLWFSQYMKLMQQKYRRQRTSAVTKLRKFIMKTLLSYTKSHSGTKSLELEALVPPETGARVVRKKASGVQREVEVKGNGGGGGGDEGEKDSRDEGRGGGREEETGGDKEKGTDGDDEKRGGAEEGKVGGEDKEKEEGDSEIEMDAALELVDQMEIEISEGEGMTGEQDVGTGGGATKTAPTTKDVVRSERGNKGQRSRARRRHSSSISVVEFHAISLEKQLSDQQTLELMNLLHVCCGLKLQSQMYLTVEETSVILSLIVCTCPPFSPAGAQFIRITLAMLLACPFLIGSSQECEKATELWMLWLLDKLPEFDRCCGESGSYGEMLLLIAIHLREKQLSQLEELISATLDITGARSGRFSHLRQIFLKVFTEEVVCLHAVSVPPTPNLSASLSGYLPVHCIHQLIRTKTFRKHSISITNWVYRQLLHLSEPLHPSLPPLLVEFVNSILLPSHSSRSYATGQSSSHTSHTPFSSEDVLRVYHYDNETIPTHHPHYSSSSPVAHSPPPGPTSTPTRLLMLYYVLVYQDTFHSNLKALLLQSADKSPTATPKAYNPSILAQIPVKQLLLYAGQNHSHYASLYPSLLRLTATHLPQLCLVEDWLRGEEEGGRVSQFSPLLRFSSSKLTPSSATAVLEQLQTSPSQALVLLSHLSSLPPPSLSPYCHALTSTLHLLLSPSVTRRVQEMYLTLWTKLNLVTPRRLWLETVSELRPPKLRNLAPPTHTQLTENPLTILRCDSRVFRCPPVLEMLLRVLAAYSSASRAWLLDHCHTQNCIAMATTNTTSSSSQMTSQERKELCVALTAAQESGIVQLLLEVCLPTKEEEESPSTLGPHLSVLREIQCLVCSYLHQVFIAEPEMVKLVHFQGYPTPLLPVMVTGVPSMHICLKFIPELVTQSHAQKQQFGILLASYMTQQYPLPEALTIADDILKRLLVLTNESPAYMREEYFSPLLPALVRICRTFPPLCSQATNILIELTRVCSAVGGSGGIFLGGPPSGKTRGGKGGGFLTSVQNTFQELVETAIVKL